MVTEEHMRALFVRANPVPDATSMELDPIQAAAYLETLEDRSSDMTQVDMATPAGVGKRRPMGAMLAGAAAVVVIAVVGVIVAQSGGDDPDVFSSEDFHGLWQTHDGVYVQFNEDGTKTAAWTLDEVAEGTLEQGTWSYDGTEFLWANIEANPGGCGGIVGRYNVERIADDTVKWNVIWDECMDRLSDLERGPMRHISP